VRLGNAIAHDDLPKERLSDHLVVTDQIEKSTVNGVQERKVRPYRPRRDAGPLEKRFNLADARGERYAHIDLLLALRAPLQSRLRRVLFLVHALFAFLFWRGRAGWRTRRIVLLSNRFLVLPEQHIAGTANLVLRSSFVRDAVRELTGRDSVLSTKSCLSAHVFLPNCLTDRSMFNLDKVLICL